MSLQEGTRVGPYEIGALLGAGGMGEVYRARDTRLDRDAALKILPDSFADDPDRLARDLDVPADWRFIGYLCIGWPEEETTVPELERAGWETRSPALHLETR